MLKKIVLLSAAVSVMGATGAVSAATCDAKDELVIGDHQPLSGTLAGLGTETHRGVILAVKHYNEGTHPLNPTPCLNVGGKKYKLSEVVYESKCTAEGGIAAAKRLVFNDGVKYVVGSVCSGAIMASADAVFEPNKVLYMNTGWNPNVIGTDKPFAFRLNPTAVEYGQAFWQWATTGGLPDVKKAGYLVHDNEAGRGAAPGALKLMRSFGMETIEPEFWPVGTTDFYPYLTRILAQKPDYINIGSTPTDEGLMFKQLRELGYEGYIHGLCNSPEVTIKAAGSTKAEGLFCMYPVDWDSGPPNITPEMERIRDEYRATWPGEEPAMLMLGVYDATVGLLEAMKMARTVEDTTKVRDVLEKFNWMLSTGYMTSWGGKKTAGIAHQVVQPVPVSQIKNGKAAVVAMPIVPVP